MSDRLRVIWIVASFDFLESLRSRKALGLLVLALLGSLSAAGIFSKVVYEAEAQLAKTLSVAHTEKVGAMADEVFHSKEFIEVATHMTGDAGLARALSEIPPIAFFSGWLGMMFLPLLVILFSSDTISIEISSGSARFALFRCDRLSWAMGKLAGQAALMTVGILVGACGTLLVAATVWHSWHPWLTTLWMLRIGARVWIYGFSYLGMALGVSMLTRSVNLSRGLGLIALFTAGFVARVLAHYEAKAPVLLPSLKQFFPQAHAMGLWQPALMDRLPSLVMLAALGVAWFSLGYSRFARRDR